MFAYSNKKLQPTSLIKISRVVCIFILVIPQFVAIAGDVKFNAGVSAKLVEQQIKTKDTPMRTIDATNILLTPFASVSYQAKDFDLFFRGTNNQVRRKLDNETTTQNFTEYNYAGNYDLFENVLSLNINGNRSYRSSSQNSFVVDDFLLNSESLNKVTSNRAQLRLNVRRGKYYGLSATSFYRITSSDRNENRVADDSVFDNENYGVSVNAVTGENLDGAKVSLTSNLQYSERDSGRDFSSQRLGISSDIEAYGDFGLALNGTYENNEIKNDSEMVDNRLREFYTVGAGIIWQPRDTRYVRVLWNRSLSSSIIDGEEDEKDNFLSFNIDWAFSSRTALQANYTRRFFGDAGNLSFRHQTKSWRSSVTYSEVVSSTSQFINTNNVGLFICDNGSADLSNCRLSDSLEPDLEPGQALQPFVVRGLALNDRIILRKSLTAQTAVTRRRTTFSLTGSRSQDDEIEINRIFDISTVRANLSFSLSQRSSIQYGYTFAKTERDQDGVLESAITKEHNINFRRQVTRRFSASLGLSYLDRNGEVTRGTPSIRGLNGPLTDRRVTFRITYDFGSR